MTQRDISTKYRQTHREQACDFQGGGAGGGNPNWEFWIRSCKLLCIGWINSTENDIEYPTINHNEKI